MMSVKWLVTSLLLVLACCRDGEGQSCPDDDPSLTVWSPGSQPTLNYIIDNQRLLLRGDTVLNTLTIRNNSVLVIEDRGAEGGVFRLSVKYIYIQTNGELHVGSETCPYTGKLDITLLGKTSDPEEIVGMGRKIIGVAPTGTLEIHGPWKQAWTLLNATLEAGSANGTTLTLADDVTSWKTGDRIVIASTDYNMYQAEEFELLDCSTCASNQVRIKGVPQYTHYGTWSLGVDMRAEVGILSRDIKIHGEMQPGCYDNNLCDYFDYDTFGGQTEFSVGFKNAHVEGVELYHMGQQSLGNYPIHFHRNYDVDEEGGYARPAYARQLSIHHCFSRCVTVHSTFGLTVEDVVGYHTLGHCFFLEDGNEQRNTFRHNLGLVSLPGTLLPSDRDQYMCETLLAGVHGNYTPVAESECMGVSTFWIAHPNNNLINNAAAGSFANGIHFVFYREPTGLSVGTLPPFQAERTPLGNVTGNRVHSNKKVGFLLDRGVKTTVANADDPREVLSLADYARFTPSVNSDPSQGRVRAVIDGLVAYKNQRQGAFARGGDIRVINSQFSDNGAGLTFASEQTLPYQEGSHQDVWNCIFVGESDNVGNNDNVTVWTPGADGRYRSLAIDPTYPIRGVQIYDGPIFVNSSSFYRFTPTSQRNSSAIGFFLQNSGQNTPLNGLSLLKFDINTQPLFFGTPGGAFGSYDNDGDLTQIVRDFDGTTTGVYGAMAVRADNYLMRFPGCVNSVNLLYAICNGADHGQLYINASTKAADLIVTSATYPDNPVTFRGVNRNDPQSPLRTQYQPVIQASETYTYAWSNPAELVDDIILTSHNLPATTYSYAKILYPTSNVVFNITYKEWDPLNDTVLVERPMTAGSVAQVQSDVNGWTYNWDITLQQLYLKMMNRYTKPPGEQYNYCALQGCEQVHVHATPSLLFM